MRKALPASPQGFLLGVIFARTILSQSTKRFPKLRQEIKANWSQVYATGKAFGWQQAEKRAWELVDTYIGVAARNWLMLGQKMSDEAIACCQRTVEGRHNLISRANEKFELAGDFAATRPDVARYLYNAAIFDCQLAVVSFEAETVGIPSRRW